MFIEHFDKIFEDRKAVGQIIQRCIGSVASIAVFLAPVLTGLIVFGDRET